MLLLSMFGLQKKSQTTQQSSLSWLGPSPISRFLCCFSSSSSYPFPLTPCSSHVMFLEGPQFILLDLYGFLFPLPRMPFSLPREVIPHPLWSCLNWVSPTLAPFEVYLYYHAYHTVVKHPVCRSISPVILWASPSQGYRSSQCCTF